MMTPLQAKVVVTRYQAVLNDPGLTRQEQAGYIHGASRVDPFVPEITIDEARGLVAAYHAQAETSKC